MRTDRTDEDDEADGEGGATHMRSMSERVAWVRAVPLWFSQVGVVLSKDVLIERRTREIVTTSAFFALLVVVMTSVSLHAGQKTRDLVAPGVIWISVAFAAVLAVSKTWQREREQGALLGLLLAPLFRSAIYAGKAMGVLVFLVIVELAVIPLAAILLSIDLRTAAGGLVLICACATPGIAIVGTLFGAMTVQTRARDLVLASVVFPLLLPVLLAAVAATRELLGGASIWELQDYIVLMLAFDALFGAGAMGLFGALMEG